MPFLTVLAPSERYFRQRGRTPQKLTGRAVRWSATPSLAARRPLVLVGDSGYVVLDLLHFCQSLPQPVTFITRLRLDAGLYEPAPARLSGQNGRPRVKGRRLPTLKELIDHSGVPWEQVSAAWYDGATRTVEIISQTAVWYHTGKPPVPIRWVLIRDPQANSLPRPAVHRLAVAPAQIMEWFVLRWQLEVTFHETRAHLGVGTQRQWSDRAIARTTPILMGLFSWVTLRPTCCSNNIPLSTAPRPGTPSRTHLRRCHRIDASPSVDCFRGGFTVGARQRQRKTPSLTIRPPHRYTCLRGLSVQSPAEIEAPVRVCQEPALAKAGVRYRGLTKSDNGCRCCPGLATC